jgi:hypothetical protein
MHYSAYGPFSNIPFLLIGFVKNKIMGARIISLLLNLGTLFLLFKYLKVRIGGLNAFSLVVVLYFPLTFLSGGIPRGDNVGLFLSVLLTSLINNNKANKQLVVMSFLFVMAFYIKMYFVIVPGLFMLLNWKRSCVVRLIIISIIFLIPLEIFYLWAYGSSNFLGMLEFGFNLKGNNGRTTNWSWSIFQLKSFLTVYFPVIIGLIVFRKHITSLQKYSLLFLVILICYLGTHTGNIHVYYFQTVPIFLCFMVSKNMKFNSIIILMIVVSTNLLFFKFIQNPFSYIVEQRELNKKIIFDRSKANLNVNQMIFSATDQIFQLKEGRTKFGYDSYNSQYVCAVASPIQKAYSTAFQTELKRTRKILVSKVGILSEKSSPFLINFHNRNAEFLKSHFHVVDSVYDRCPFAGQNFKVLIYEKNILSSQNELRR